MGNNLLAYQAIDATVTVADATTETPDVTIQLIGPNGENLKEAAAVDVYLSSDSAGQVLAIDGTDTSEFVIKTNGMFIEYNADVAGKVITEANGKADMTATIVTTKKAYLNVVLPNGKIVTSAQMSYTAGS